MAVVGRLRVNSVVFLLGSDLQKPSSCLEWPGVHGAIIFTICSRDGAVCVKRAADLWRPISGKRLIVCPKQNKQVKQPDSVKYFATFVEQNVIF